MDDEFPTEPVAGGQMALVRRFLRAWIEQDAVALRLLAARRTREERRLPESPPSPGTQTIVRGGRVEPGGAVLYDLLLSDPGGSPSSRRLVVRVLREDGSQRVEVLRKDEIDRLDREIADGAGDSPIPEGITVFQAVRAEMRRLGVWDVPHPGDEAIARGGAFGGASMAFVQWLRWVWAERAIRALADGGGALPPRSQLADYAVRAFDGQPEYGPLIDRLRDVDAFVASRPGRSPDDRG